MSEFTGAGTYSYSFNVPPAPGGLQPTLGLSYNSQTADSVSSYTSAPSVGMGWNLDGIGYIMRDTHEDQNSTADDTFSLVMNGISSRILKADDQKWHTEDESFVNISYTAAETLVDGWEWWDYSYWIVKDKLGNQYRFDAMARYPQFPSGLGACLPHSDKNFLYKLAWYYGLTEITDIYGNKTHFNYQYESTTYYFECGQQEYPDQTYHQHNAYPTSIEYPYPNPKYRIQFIYADRGDWDYGGMLSTLRFFTKKALTTIRVLDLSSTPNKIIREYALGYTWPSTTKGQTETFPNVRRQAGPGEYDPIYYGILTLDSITEKIGNPNNLPTTSPSSELRSLPAISFSYSDFMHLTEVSNGMGGKIKMTYETTPWYTKQAPEDAQHTNESNVYSVGGILYAWIDAKNFRLGGNYQLDYKVRTVPENGTTTTQAQYEYWGYESGTYVESAPFTVTTSLETHSAFVYTSPKSSQGAFVLDCNCGDGLWADEFNAYPVVTRYRVTKREVIDERVPTTPDLGLSTYTKTYTYGYSNPSINNTSFGDVDGYDKWHVEYRGNEIVAQTDPYGLKTYSFYNQSHALKGKPVTQIVQSHIFADGMDNYLTNWYKSGDGSAIVTQITDPYSGNISTQIVGTSSGYGIAARVSHVSIGDMLWVKFRVTGTDQGFVIAADKESGSNYRSFGVKSFLDGSNTKVQFFYKMGSTVTSTDAMDYVFDPNSWYTAILVYGESHLFGYIFMTDDPQFDANQSLMAVITVPELFHNTTTAFQPRITAIGPQNPDPSKTTLYIDHVSVGELFQLSQTAYKDYAEDST